MYTFHIIENYLIKNLIIFSTIDNFNKLIILIGLK